MRLARQAGGDSHREKLFNAIEEKAGGLHLGNGAGAGQAHTRNRQV
jgi:hypothetical protein